MDQAHLFTGPPDERRDLIGRNLLEFLRANVGRGREAEIAINAELEQVVVFIEGEVVLSCSFDDLLAGPGACAN